LGRVVTVWHHDGSGGSRLFFFVLSPAAMIMMMVGSKPDERPWKLRASRRVICMEYMIHMIGKWIGTGKGLQTDR
jgi:hypothetical protein